MVDKYLKLDYKDKRVSCFTLLCFVFITLRGMEIAQMFGKEIKMLPERKGNRMLADIFTDKTEALGWSPLFSIESHIKDFCLKNKK